MVPRVNRACEVFSEGFVEPPGAPLVVALRAAAAARPEEKTVKFMVLVKATPETEAGVVGDPAIFEAMGKFNEEMIDAGVLIAGEGLQSSSKGARLRYSKGRYQVTDGPFAETKELIAGFWIIEVKDKDEAIAWTKKYPFAEGEEIEIRRVWEASDWEEAGLPPELFEEDKRLREKEAELKTKK
jgi:hypothetical protein